MPSIPASPSTPVSPASLVSPDPASGPAHGQVPETAILGGTAQADPEVIDPAFAYGPFDPGYGPPGPDWYTRDTGTGEPATDDAHQASAPAGIGADADAQSIGRGPFEPLQHVDFPGAGDEPGAGDHPVAGLGDGMGAAGDPGAVDQAPDVLDFGPEDAGDSPLDRLRNLYATAEAIGPARFDGHFEELLDRQRRLIREYLSESGGTTGSGPQVQPVVGFENAESLSELRGEFR
jgi:hypothetical protein